jgi:hypothetical protein
MKPGCLLRAPERDRSHRIDPGLKAEEHRCGSLVGVRTEANLKAILRGLATLWVPDCSGLLVDVISGTDPCGC